MYAHTYINILLYFRLTLYYIALVHIIAVNHYNTLLFKNNNNNKVHYNVTN